jgi:antitoxin component HigA of HigAB toxin-antitoxin module
MQLIEEFPLRRITSRTSHAKAMKIARRLSNRGGDRGAQDYLDILIDLIVEYEKRAGWSIDTSRVTAADLVRHSIAERGMSISELARVIGVSQSNLSEMLNGRRDWSKAAIRALSSHLNIKVERFLRNAI